MIRASEEGRDLCDRLVASLKKRIVHWEFVPGYRLLETDICREYQVSRSPAREALRTLAGDGYVEKRPGKGYRVVQLNVGKAHELYDVRLALELFVVEGLARGNTDQEALGQLARAWKSKADVGVDAQEFADMDREFHEAMATLMNNATLLEQLQSINERIHVFRAIEFAHPERREATRAQHSAIIAAIADQDVAAARAAVASNIESARGNVAETIKEALARAYLEEKS